MEVTIQWQPITDFRAAANHPITNSYTFLISNNNPIMNTFTFMITFFVYPDLDGSNITGGMSKSSKHLDMEEISINSLAPGKFGLNYGYVIFRWILVITGWGISCEIALIWMSLDLTDDQSTLVQVMAWCREATSHYLRQCWPRSMSPCGVTRPQWVKCCFMGLILIISAVDLWWIVDPSLLVSICIIRPGRIQSPSLSIITGNAATLKINKTIFWSIHNSE